MKKCLSSIYKLLCLFVLGGMPLQGHGAACCGGGSSSASLITGDYLAQFSLSSSYSDIAAMQTNGKAIFWEDGHSQRTLTYKISAGAMVSEKSQVGISTEMLKKDYSFISGNRESSTRMGDITLQAGHELLRESYYNSLLPRILLGLAHSLPTGIGLEESKKSGLSDVSGLGRHQTSLSLLMLKRTASFMFSLKLEAHQRWKRKQRGGSTVGASTGESLEVSLTRLPPKSIFTYGGSFATLWNSAHKVRRSTGTEYKSADERVSEVAIFSALALAQDWETSLRYVDQTLIGPAKNSTLSRTVSLALTKYISL